MPRREIAAVAGLSAGAAVAALALLQPPASLLGSAPFVIAAAHMWVVAIAAIASIAATLAAGRRYDDPSGVVAAAVWFGPAVLFAMEGALAAPITVSVAAALSALLFPSAGGERAGAGIETLLKPSEPSWFVPRVQRRFPPAACAVVAVLAALSGHVLVSAAAGAVFAGFVSSRLAGRATPAMLRRRALISTATAVVCTSVALARYAHFGRGGGDGLFAGGASQQEQALEPQRQGEGDGDAPVSQGDSAALDGDYSGVILWPEQQANTVLVPPLPAMTPNLFGGARVSEPLSIPFFGVYWLYRRPQRQPPRNSYSTRGDPAKLSFRSTDRVPLLMEARQNLGRTVDARCCREVRIAIRNSDRYPGTLALELLMVNSDAKQAPPLSLGRAAVTSTPRWSPEGREDVPETLVYAVPSAPLPPQFDEFRIVFHRSNFGLDRSARVAIDRFILVRR